MEWLLGLPSSSIVTFMLPLDPRYTHIILRLTPPMSSIDGPDYMRLCTNSITDLG